MIGDSERTLLTRPNDHPIHSFGGPDGQPSLALRAAPSQFETGALRNPPRLTALRILAGIAIAAVVIGAGYALRSPTSPLLHCDETYGCSHPAGSGMSLQVWYGAGVLVGALVIAWPWLGQAVQRLLRRN
jgi:hypothetical protein